MKGPWGPSTVVQELIIFENSYVVISNTKPQGHYTSGSIKTRADCGACWRE
jgi:hypothetical protein